jgi:signal transduction histidine kinase
MAVEFRDSGIQSVGSLPWGTHFCHFYETVDDLLDILVPFLKAGLENNEFCMWVVFDPVNKKQARQALERAVPDVNQRIAAGDIEILAHTDWYLHDGVFDARRVILAWKEKLAQALARGYAGMRVNGDATWLTEHEWEDFSQYEREINQTLADERMIVLCTFPLGVSRGAGVFDVARTHQFAIAKRHGNWDILESPQLKQTKEELLVLKEELEDRVLQRTLALEEANGRLRSLSGSLQRATEQESKRIAREIHDQLGAALASLRWDLEGLEKSLSDTATPCQPAELSRKVAAMMRLTDQTVDAVRRIASELRPSILDDLGLAEAVESQAEQFQARTGIVCRFKCFPDSVDLTPERSTAVFRILQEALTNVLRHAQATQVDITIEQLEGMLVVTIADNGKGIAPGQETHCSSLGIWGMQERAHLVGARVDVAGLEGKGTTVTVRVPAA